MYIHKVYTSSMKFAWDPEKNQRNKADHDGIGFEDAQHIFDGPVLSGLDSREDYGEDREIAYGTIGIGTVLAVVFTERGETMRIISARKATRSETRDYYAYLEEAFGGN